MVGLAFFSHKVIRCLGTTVCKMTATRGFCAEIATAITVAIASRYGALPPFHTSACAVSKTRLDYCCCCRRHADPTLVSTPLAAANMQIRPLSCHHVLWRFHLLTARSRGSSKCAVD